MCQTAFEYIHELNGDRLVRVYDRHLREVRLDPKNTVREEGIYCWKLPEGEFYLACYAPQIADGIRRLSRLTVNGEGVHETVLPLDEYPTTLRRICCAA